jgi:hypothetical protein
MGAIKAPEKVKFFCGVIAADGKLLEAARLCLAEAFGPIDQCSDIWPFDFTDYYRAEMGSALLRQFVVFSGSRDPGELADAKRRADRLERGLAVPEEGAVRRRVNLDPGYLTPAKLVLATTKDFAHRLYLGSGIYAEVTLNFRRGGITALPWTYPDYASGRYTPFFMEVRRRHMEELAVLCGDGPLAREGKGTPEE